MYYNKKFVGFISSMNLLYLHSTYILYIDDMCMKYIDLMKT